MRNAIRRYLYVVLAFNILSGGLPAEAQGTQFSARTLGGGTVSSASFGGDVVLLQFWATWCQYCRKDQAAVDQIASEFSSSGLSVLAIDVGESEAEVNSYLQKNPRSVRVALDPSHSLASRFGASGFPYYVVLDRQGNIAARTSGAGGEDHLRALLRRAGLGVKSSSAQAAAQQAPPATGANGPKWITMAGGQTITSAKPLPKTVFIFDNGEQLESEHYTIRDGYLDIAVSGQERRMPISSLDVKKTVAANHERGIDLKIPTSKSEIFLGF